MPYRRRLIRIAAGLVFAIAALAIIQWAIGTRGWDLSAGLLTVVMVGLGFGLVSVIIMIGAGKPTPAEHRQDNDRLFGKDDDWPHYNDPSYLGSPLNRSPFND